jgi:hypothetical protein
MDGHVSKDLFQIDVGERAVLAPLEVPGTTLAARLAGPVTIVGQMS